MFSKGVEERGAGAEVAVEAAADKSAEESKYGAGSAASGGTISSVRVAGDVANPPGRHPVNTVRLTLSRRRAEGGGEPQDAGAREDDVKIVLRAKMTLGRAKQPCVFTSMMLSREAVTIVDISKDKISVMALSKGVHVAQRDGSDILRKARELELGGKVALAPGSWIIVGETSVLVDEIGHNLDEDDGEAGEDDDESQDNSLPMTQAQGDEFIQATSDLAAGARWRENGAPARSAPSAAALAALGRPLDTDRTGTKRGSAGDRTKQGKARKKRKKAERKKTMDQEKEAARTQPAASAAAKASAGRRKKMEKRLEVAITQQNYREVKKIAEQLERLKNVKSHKKMPQKKRRGSPGGQQPKGAKKKSGKTTKRKRGDTSKPKPSPKARRGQEKRRKAKAQKMQQQAGNGGRGGKRVRARSAHARNQRRGGRSRAHGG